MHSIMKKSITILAGCLAMTVIIAGTGCQGLTNQTETETADAELNRTDESPPAKETETADAELNRTNESPPAKGTETADAELNRTDESPTAKGTAEEQVNTIRSEDTEGSNEGQGTGPKTTQPAPDHTPRDVTLMLPTRSVTPAGASLSAHWPIRTLEEILEEGQYSRIRSPAHIAVRAGLMPGTIRCAYRGLAMTMENRERYIRFWHQVEDGEPLPSIEEMEAWVEDLAEYVGEDDGPYIRAEEMAVVMGGLATSYRYLTCYGDYRVSDYILGSGPDQITIAFDHVGFEARESYELYKEGHRGGYYDDDPFRSEEEHDAETDRRIDEAEQTFREILEGRETLLFLHPLAQVGAMPIEGWGASQTWDVQEDAGGTLLAVRHGISETQDEYSQTLERFMERVIAGAATDTAAGERLENINELHRYYLDFGAYTDITPYDGSDQTFMPAMPPPVPTCAGSTAVGTDPDPGLVSDCNALLDMKDTLAGTATLNWSQDLAMADWDGIRLGGTPPRIPLPAPNRPGPGRQDSSPAGEPHRTPAHRP